MSESRDAQDWRYAIPQWAHRRTRMTGISRQDETDWPR
jgi:hypothetical protein